MTRFSGCCIYEKPKAFGESSSDDSDDECEHCHGHKDNHKNDLPINKPENPSAEIPHSGKRNLLFYKNYEIIIFCNNNYYLDIIYLE